MEVSITNATKRPTPRIPFQKIKDQVLGSRYELSVVFCGNHLSQHLNGAYRGKDSPTNVLAFPIEKNYGEIFINLSKLEPFSALYLFIHGVLHLKGMEHGSKMESNERKLLSQFNGAHHSSRNRSRKLRS